MLQTLIGRGGGTDRLFEQKMTSVKQYLSFRFSNLSFVRCAPVTRKFLVHERNAFRKLDLFEDMLADFSNGIHKMIAVQAKKAIPLTGPR